MTVIKKKLSICLIDDHQLIREGIRSILNETTDMTISSEFSNIDEFYCYLNTHKPTWDILLLDITLPETTGLDEVGTIKKILPSLPILILTMHDETQFGVRAMKNGVDGYITKDNASQELIIAIKKVLTGKKYISAEFSNLVALDSFGENSLPSHHSLSRQEFNVFLGLAKGFSPTQIAEQLSVSIKTVSTYRARILVKLNFTNNAEITKYCLANRLII